VAHRRYTLLYLHGPLGGTRSKEKASSFVGQKVSTRLKRGSVFNRGLLIQARAAGENKRRAKGGKHVSERRGGSEMVNTGPLYHHKKSERKDDVLKLSFHPKREASNQHFGTNLGQVTMGNRVRRG